MRILMLSQFYPPIIGGIEQHVQSLSRELVARGHEVAVATLWQENLLDYEVDQGVQVFRLHGTLQQAEWLFGDKARRHAPPFPDPAVVAGLKNVIARTHPDVVHAHNWLVHSFLPLKAWSGARLVATLHDYGLVCAKQRLVYHEAACAGPGLKCLECAAAHYGLARGVPTVLANWTMGLAERAAVDMFLPVSHAVAEGTGLVDSSHPYEVIPNFIPDRIGVIERNGDADDTRLPSEDYILFVGDISRDKGVPVLLQAYAKLARPVPLVLLGRVMIPIPNNLNVVVVPGLPHAAVMRTWSRAMLGVAPSVWRDPCPTVAMEAMAMGRPVVASRIGGLTDLVSDEETGLLVPPGDVNLLRDAIQRLIDHPELRTKMGQAAQRRVRDFQAGSVLPRIEQVYAQLLGNRSVARPEIRHSRVLDERGGSSHPRTEPVDFRSFRQLRKSG